MILAILIILIITLVGLIATVIMILNFSKSTQNKISQTEDDLNKSINQLKTELLLKIQDVNNTTEIKSESTKTEIKSTVKETSKVVQEDLNIKSKEIVSNSSNAISDARKTIIDSIEPSIQEIKNTTALHFEKLSMDIYKKLDSIQQDQDQKQNELFKDIKNKFDGIIEEIKRPLTID